MSESTTAWKESATPISRADVDAFERIMADKRLSGSDETVEGLLARDEKESAYFQAGVHDAIMGKTGLFLSKRTRALPIGTELDHSTVRVWTHGKDITVVLEPGSSLEEVPYDLSPDSFFPVSETLVVQDYNQQECLRRPRFNPGQMGYHEGVVVSKDDLVNDSKDGFFVKENTPVTYIDEDELSSHLGNDNVVIIRTRKEFKDADGKRHFKDVLEATSLNEEGEVAVFEVASTRRKPDNENESA